MPKVPIDYAKTIIYKLVHKDDLYDENIYTGHTTEMTKRKNKHKSDSTNPNSDKYNQNKYKYIRENGGWDEWLMIEIEKYPCKDKPEAVARERVIQAEMKATLNDNVPGRTKKEYYQDNREIKLEYQKEYRQDNRDKILEKAKQYHQDNREKILEYNKQYRQDNREKISERRKQLYQDNREKMLEKITCECGCISTKGHLSRHRNTDKHKKKMEALTN